MLEIFGITAVLFLLSFWFFSLEVSSDVYLFGIIKDTLFFVGVNCVLNNSWPDIMGRENSMQGNAKRHRKNQNRISAFSRKAIIALSPLSTLSKATQAIHSWNCTLERYYLYSCYVSIDNDVIEYYIQLRHIREDRIIIIFIL